MTRYSPTILTLAAALLCSLMFGGSEARADTQAELDATVEEIDMKLYEQNEADIRALLVKLIETYWKPGQTFNVYYDCAAHGSYGAMWFRGYEMLGDEKYLKAGLDMVDGIIQTQYGNGMFPNAARLQRGGKSSPAPNTAPRLEDAHNFVQFALVCYAYKVSGDKKYLDAALKHAEALRSCQDPTRDATWMGPWPHTWHNATKPLDASGPNYGQNHCYMLNDYATWDSMRTMVMAYKLSGDKKFIERISPLSNYLFKSQVGLGNVRGWRDMTDAWDKTTWQRRHEGPLIDPRNFNRFTCPMLAYFAAVTGRDAGLNMIRESYDWLRSVEQPGGFGAKYTYDGREGLMGAYRVMLTDAYHGRSKVLLDGAEIILAAIGDDGVEGLRKWYGSRPVKYDEQQYLAARLEAARRITDEELTVRMCAMDELAPVTGKFLDRVRQRPAKSATTDLDQKGGWAWVWWRPGAPHPYRGWTAWQYVWDVRVARGKIDPDTAAWGGRGLESAGAPTWFFPKWDTVGDWSTKAVEAENWLDIPFEAPFTPVQSVRLEPASMSLRLTEIKEIKPIFTPADATCQSGTWTVKAGFAVCWVKPQMRAKIDSSVVRPAYPRDGKINVHAGLPHGFPGKGIITFTSTDGKHTATCEVTVTP
jgi:hypothetical protein